MHTLHTTWTSRHDVVLETLAKVSFARFALCPEPDLS